MTVLTISLCNNALIHLQIFLSTLFLPTTSKMQSQLVGSNVTFVCRKHPAAISLLFVLHIRDTMFTSAFCYEYFQLICNAFNIYRTAFYLGSRRFLYQSSSIVSRRNDFTLIGLQDFGLSYVLLPAFVININSIII